MIFKGSYFGQPPTLEGLQTKPNKVLFGVRQVIEKFYALFGSKTTTLADGTRQLVNEGTSAVNGTLHSGHGLAMDGVSNYVDTGYSHSLNDSFTWFVDLPLTGIGCHGYINYANPRLHIEDSNNGNVIIGVGNSGSYRAFNTGLNIGEVANLAITYDSSSKEVITRVLNSGVVHTFTAYVENTTPYPIYLGARLSDGLPTLFVSGAIGASYFIKDMVLTAQEIAQHYNNPEQTLYWEKGTLKSAFLPQSTIDAMQAGNGFWYPLSENVSAGAYMRNHALPMAGNLFSEFTVQAHWTDNGDGSYSCDSDGTMGSRDIYVSILEDGVEYVLDIEITDYASGALYLWRGGASLVGESSGTFRVVFTASGVTTLTLYASVVTGFIGTIDNIKAYPLENSGLTPMVNWTESATTGAQALPYGNQQLLMPSDSFGLQSDVGIPGELYGDGRSYVDMGGLTISGDFELDLYVNSSDWPNNSGNALLDVGGVLVTHNANKNLVAVTFDSSGSQTGYFGLYEPYKKFVLTIAKHGETVYFYKDNAGVITKTEASWKNFILTKYANLISEDTGTLQITEGTRTDEQRLKDVTKLATKHGVTL